MDRVTSLITNELPKYSLAIEADAAMDFDLVRAGCIGAGVAGKVNFFRLEARHFEWRLNISWGA